MREDGLNRSDKIGKEQVHIVVAFIQRHPGAGHFAGFKPAAYLGALAVSGRCRDQGRMPVKTLVEPVLQFLTVYVVVCNRRPVQLDTDEPYGEGLV